MPRVNLTDRYYEHAAIGENEYRLYDLNEEPFIENCRQVLE